MSVKHADFKRITEEAGSCSLLVSIRNVLSSNSARDIDYPDFAESLQGSAGNDVTLASFPIRYSKIIPSFGAT
jgi:hypothetical protein